MERPTRWVLGGATLVGAVVLLVWTLQPPPRGDVARAEAFHGLVIAHRGGCHRAPENTVAAIEQAARDGADAVEVDVHLSADGVPVVLHDTTVDRTTGGRGAVRNLSMAELRELDAGIHWPAVPFAPIPSLEEVVHTCERLDLKLEIELKREAHDHGQLVRAVVDLIHREDLYDRVWVGSFDPRLVYRVRRADPRIVTGFAMRDGATHIGPLDAVLTSAWLPRWLGVDLVEPHHQMLDDGLRRWREAGYGVNAWTVNPAALQQRMQQLGVSYTTNCPRSGCADRPEDDLQASPGL